jgi:hypothetical protein
MGIGIAVSLHQLGAAIKRHAGRYHRECRYCYCYGCLSFHVRVQSMSAVVGRIVVHDLAVHDVSAQW